MTTKPYLLKVHASLQGNEYTLRPTNYRDKFKKMKFPIGRDDMMNLLQKIGATDNGTEPRSTMNITYEEMMNQVENGKGTFINVWSTQYPKEECTAIEKSFQELVLTKDQFIEGKIFEAGARFRIKEYNKDYYYVYVDMQLPEIIEVMNTLHRVIPEEVVYDNGEEDSGIIHDYHITSFYGLKEDILTSLNKFFYEEIPFIDISLQDISYFETEDYDVAKIGIKSKALQKIFDFIKQFDNEWSYPIYQPHMTIAYLKKNSFRYEEMFNKLTNGLYIEIDSLKYKDRYSDIYNLYTKRSPINNQFNKSE